MKNILVIDEKKKLTSADIDLLEENLRVKLPVEYKKFLLLHNGGHPEKTHYPTLSKALDGANIAWFYAFYEGETSSIINEYEKNKDIIPEEFIPIAYGSGGNEICLGISGHVFGKVYFFIRNWEVDENGKPIPDDMCTIANNFTDFINSLYRFVDLKKDSNGEEIWIYSHDKYSLPFSTEAKKYGVLVTNFFMKAPVEVEDYIIEEIESTKDLLLWYEVKSENKKYCRNISKDGEIKDYQEVVLTQY